MVLFSRAEQGQANFRNLLQPPMCLWRGLPPMRETRVRSLGWEDPLKKEMVTHSSMLVWRIPWTEKPGRLQSTGSQRVRLDFTFTFTTFKIIESEHISSPMCISAQTKPPSSLIKNPNLKEIILYLLIWLHWVLVIPGRILSHSMLDLIP